MKMGTTASPWRYDRRRPEMRRPLIARIGSDPGGSQAAVASLTFSNKIIALRVRTATSDTLGNPVRGRTAALRQERSFVDQLLWNSSASGRPEGPEIGIQPLPAVRICSWSRRCRAWPAPAGCVTAGSSRRRLPNAIMARGNRRSWLSPAGADTCSSDPTVRILGPRRTRR